MRKYNYITDSYEDDGQPDLMDSVMSGIMPAPKQDIPVEQPAVKSEMNPMVKEYLLSKMNPEQAAPSESPLDQFNDEKYNDTVNQMKERQSGLALAQLAAGFGDALARRDSSSSDRYFQDVRSNIQDQTVGEFNRKKKMAVEDYNNKRNFDVNSDESKIAQSLAVKMGINPDMAKRLTAAKFKEMSPVLEKMYAVEQQKQMKNMYQSEIQNEKRAQKARLSDKQIEAFTDIDNASSDLNNILAQLGDKNNWTGPIDGRVPDMLIGKDQAAWRSSVGKYKDAYRKAITGAGAGPTEIAMLETRLPSENDTPENFRAKAQEAQRELERRRNVLATNLEKGGKNVEQFKTSVESPPQNDVEAKIASFMKKNNISDRNEAIKILKENGKI